MPHPYTLIAGMVNPKLRYKSRAMNHYVTSHMNSSGSGPHHFALQKQFNSPSAVKMRKTISKQKAGLKKRAWSDSSLEPQKKKMKNGGSLTGLKASNKRVGPVDPKGAFTAVQTKTLAGAKGKASLTKDKQLGATKMAKSGTKISKK